MNNKVIVIGGGGHARVIIDIIRLSHDKIEGVLDDVLEPGCFVGGYPVLGKVEDMDK